MHLLIKLFLLPHAQILLCTEAPPGTAYVHDIIQIKKRIYKTNALVQTLTLSKFSFLDNSKTRKIKKMSRKRNEVTCPLRH